MAGTPIRTEFVNVQQENQQLANLIPSNVDGSKYISPNQNQDLERKLSPSNGNPNPTANLPDMADAVTARSVNSWQQSANTTGIGGMPRVFANLVPYDPNDPDAKYVQFAGGANQNDMLKPMPVIRPKSTSRTDDPDETQDCKSEKPVPVASTSTMASVKPFPGFNARTDCETLHGALWRLFSDKDIVIEILCNRSQSQRAEIIEKFNEIYNKSLVTKITSKIGSYLQQLLLALLQSPTEFTVNQLKLTLNVNSKAVVEILVTKSNNEINQIVAAYQKLYSRDLAGKIRSKTSGTTMNLILQLLEAKRDESNTIDVIKAQNDAQSLIKQDKISSNDSLLIPILVSQNYRQLNAMFSEFEKTGGSIEKSIKKTFSGASREAVLTVVSRIRNYSEFFAEILWKSMKGFRIDYQTIMRIIVDRSEIDLLLIADSFNRKYNVTLESKINV